jgi:NhaA family Na+:H+ antiporter
MNSDYSKGNPFKEFFESEKNGGIILIVCVVAALFVANSPFQDEYFRFLAHKLGLAWDNFVLKKSVEHWINDGLMAIFFLLVGLEIKREIHRGELAAFKKALLPVSAALGGMIFPALSYAAFNVGGESSRGWAIPMATDIAFALGILSLLRDKVPSSLRIFLAALAIADDLGAIIVIAVFYTKQLYLTNLAIAFALFLFLLLLNRMGVRKWAAFLIPGILMWYFVYKSGVHATIAGVLLAMTIPSQERNNGTSMLETLEHAIQKPVNYLIMPIFAIANTGIIIESKALEGLGTPLSLGIMAGLVVGKPLGILFFTWLPVKLGLSGLPENVRFNHVLGVGFLGGIGFTMSIFISLLSFDQSEARAIAKMSILAASAVAGLVGYIILSRSGKN